MRLRTNKAADSQGRDCGRQKDSSWTSSSSTSSSSSSSSPSASRS
uniref:Uncharacterized protein n=1 Tax=Heterorhabditis bacteriophora TaxID=37862 RepID=A0A1I7WJR8_HETBA